MIRVEIENEILGDSVFWEGPSKRIGEITNIVARRLASLVVKDNIRRKSGMWIASAVCDHCGIEGVDGVCSGCKQGFYSFHYN